MPKAIRFAETTPFLKNLRESADAHLAERGVPRHGGARIIAKSALILTALVASYLGLVFYATELWQALLLGFALSQAITMVGFNIMHDGGHRAFSNRGWLNKAMVLTLDLIGASHALWLVKHGYYHHSFPNIDALDDDLETGGLLRLHPDQPWRPHHRWQALYAPFLYSLLAIHWIVSDFWEFFAGRIGTRRTNKPKLGAIVVFLLFKANFVLWAFVLPMTLHTWWHVIGMFLLVFLTVGLCIALTFQLAHVNEAVEFPTELEDDAQLDVDWAAHQLRTTADFAPLNPVLGFYMGGLNHQVVHHLMPRYSHVRYRTLQPIVAETARAHGLTYRVYPTLRAAIRGHWRVLRRLSQAPSPVGAESAAASAGA